MEDFLNYLAWKSFHYHQILYLTKPKVHSSDDCFERIKLAAKNEEIIQIINTLPLEEEKIVRDKFDELRKTA